MIKLIVCIAICLIVSGCAAQTPSRPLTEHEKYCRAQGKAMAHKEFVAKPQTDPWVVIANTAVMESASRKYRSYCMKGWL